MPEQEVKVIVQWLLLLVDLRVADIVEKGRCQSIELMFLLCGLQLGTVNELVLVKAPSPLCGAHERDPKN